MDDWERFRWVADATEASIAVLPRNDETAHDVVRRLGAAEDAGEMTFDEALDLEDSFGDYGDSDRRSAVQIGRADPRCWVTVEPNGFRTSLEADLLALADGGPAASFFWNVNMVMALTKVEDGRLVEQFDPLLDEDETARCAPDLDFEAQPSASSLALLERWTGAAISEALFLSAKPTFVVRQHRTG